MAVLTGVRPKIRGDGSDTPPCAHCGIITEYQIIETYVVSKEGGDEAPTVTRKDLCGDCLVGHHVAVQRSSSDWCFGEVKEHDVTKLRSFRISFLDDKEEWADVSPTPTKDYLKFISIGWHHINVAQHKKTPPSLELMDYGSIGSFSSSSFSSMSTFDGGNALPLFDDANLLHVHSFGLDDDKKGSTIPHFCGSTKETKTKPRTALMWTKEEDVNLKTVVNSFKERGNAVKWPEVAKHCGSRNGKQCRERWCV